MIAGMTQQQIDKLREAVTLIEEVAASLGNTPPEGPLSNTLVSGQRLLAIVDLTGREDILPHNVTNIREKQEERYRLSYASNH